MEQGIGTPEELETVFNFPAIAQEWQAWASKLSQVCQISDRRTGGVNSGDRRALFYLARSFRPTRVLEIGTHVGASTVHLAAALIAASHRSCLVTVDVEDVNDSAEDARALVRLLRGVKAKVNLIPFNDWDGARFRRPPLPRILAFQSILLDAGVTTTVRWSKGEDIGAACGQLKELAASA